MSKGGTKFYDVHSFMGTIGVTEFSFAELIAVNGLGVIIMFILMGLLAAFFPLLMLIFYILFLLIGNWYENDLDRSRTNLAAVIGYIYFMVDYHYGFIGWKFVHSFFGKEGVDELCYLNTTLFVVNLFLVFYGTKIFGDMKYGIVRVGVFIAMLFFTNKVVYPISETIIPKIVSQYVEPIEPTNNED
jgi:hypothetical protein